jgi:23S rRNA (cytidine1920-2'-O)/16S rRNA (cytidine1409-2'-O)-methyltransferase
LKKRIDRVLVERGLAESREKAQAMIMAGNVLVDNEPALKAGMPVGSASISGLPLEDSLTFFS